MSDTEFSTHDNIVSSAYEQLKWVSAMLYKLAPDEIVRLIPAVKELESQVVDMLYADIPDYHQSRSEACSESQTTLSYQ